MADIQKFTEDLAIIQKLGDNPNTDNGLSAAELKAKFDAAALAIQKFINDVLIPGVNNRLQKGMGFDMSGKKITGLGNPTADGDAVNLGYSKKNFAPAGYGLGPTAISIDSVFNITGNGWWITKGDTPDGNWWMCRSMYTNSGNRIEVTADSVSGNHRARISKNTTWGEWEWKNPPMMPGVEYRTTERHNGKAVYRKLVVQEYTSDLEGLTALDIVHGTGFDELVWVNGIAHCSDGKEVPFQPAYVTSGVTGSFRVSKSSGTWSAPTIEIEMAYTKTT